MNDYLKNILAAAEELFGVDSEVFTNVSGESWKSRTHYDNTQQKETWSGQPVNRFTPEQRRELNEMKSLAIDVEYEEIQV